MMGKITTHILILLFIHCNLSAQQEEYNFRFREYKETPKIGLALSGGAAHGLAHIGVIQYLDEVGIDIDYVTGTSMGAVIGALHAMGYNGKELETIAKEIDWDKILNNTIEFNGVSPIEKFYHSKYPLKFVINDKRILLPQGLLNTNRLELTLARLFSPAREYSDYTELPRPFKCFGVDIETGNVVTMSNGKLAESLRASMAIPSIFAPKKVGDTWIVDGGLKRNFPVVDNLEMGADIVLGSYVGREKAEISELENLLDILSESAFMMSIADSKEQVDRTDILFCPDVKGLGVFDFNSYEDFIREGYLSAKQHHDELMALVGITSQFPPKEKATKIETPKFLFIDSIKIENLPLADAKLALDKFIYKPRTHLSYDMIEVGIANIMSSLSFNSVTYEITKNGEKNILHIYAQPRKYRRLGVNVNYFSNTNSSLIISGQVRNMLLRLSNFRMTARLSDNPAFMAEYYFRAGSIHNNLLVGIRGSAKQSDHIFFSNSNRIKDGLLWSSSITPYLAYEFTNNSILQASIDFRNFNFQNQVRATLDIDEITNSNIRTSLTYSYDNRDARVFAKKGSHLRLSAGYGFNAYDLVDYTAEEARTLIDFPKSKSYFDAEIFFSQTIPVRSKFWWNITLDGFFKSNPSLLDVYHIGGTTANEEDGLAMMGYRTSELFSDRHIYARSSLRFHIIDQITIAPVVNFIVAQNNSFRYSAPGRNTNYFAYGAGVEVGVSTPIGPLILDAGYNSTAGKVRGTLSVGWRHFY